MRRPPHRIVGTIALASGAVAFALVGVPQPATAASVAGTVSVYAAHLVVRDAASTTAPRTGTLDNGARVTVECQVTGEPVAGRVRTTDRWDRLAGGGWVSDAFVRRDESRTPRTCAGAAPSAAASPVTPSAAPGPTAPPAPATIAARPKTLPTPSGRVTGPWTQPVGMVHLGGFRTPERPEHDGVDLMATREEPILAASAGTVVTAKCNASTVTCDEDGSPEAKGCGWYVEVRHAGDVVTRYCHLVREPSVKVGDKVAVGHVLGYVGTSGHSSGPHLHFEVHLGYPATHDNAVDPVTFMQQIGAPLTTATPTPSTTPVVKESR